MDVKKLAEEITTKQMDRREFITSIGAAALTIVGVSSMLKAFNLHGNRSAGYGSSSYGGASKRG